MRRQLGPAAQAGTEAGILGLRRMVEETAVLALGRFHAADRPAINAGGGHAGEEAAVKTRVPRLQGEVAVVVGERGVFAVHGRNDTPQAGFDWPFSDMSLGLLSSRFFTVFPLF